MFIYKYLFPMVYFCKSALVQQIFWDISLSLYIFDLVLYTVSFANKTFIPLQIGECSHILGPHAQTCFYPRCINKDYRNTVKTSFTRWVRQVNKYQIRVNYNLVKIKLKTRTRIFRPKSCRRIKIYCLYFTTVLFINGLKFDHVSY